MPAEQADWNRGSNFVINHISLSFFLTFFAFKNILHS